MMRRLVIATVAVAAIAGAGVVVATGGSGDSPAADAVGSTSTATTTIKRQDLVEIETEDGTLGYADARSVANRLPGVVTWLPDVGSVVRPDRALYKVADEPVILLNGRIPAYRPLRRGVSEGPDVVQLERSLRDRDYDRDRQMQVDGVWDDGTTAAVKRWQDAHGLAQTGAIEFGRVAFLPGARRVASTQATLGGQGGRLTTTSTRRRVTVALDTTNAELAKAGDRVTIELPSDAKVPGRIASVGKVATAIPPEEGAAPSSSTATIKVTIRLLSREAALDQAPVTVRFQKSRRKDVLAIPVTALLARPGATFAVQLADPGAARRIVAVKPGLYTSGFVEITGPGLKPGQRVTNAALR